MRLFQSVLLSLFLLFAGHGAIAQLRLPAIIGNNMVLQQQAEVNLWGWSNSNEKIRITPSWHNVTDSVVANGDGFWKKTIKTPPAGGPYSIVFKAGNSITIDNVLIGEVWLCSGQSNMEWSAMNNNKQSLEEAPNATNQQIRFFHIPRLTSNYPQDDCKAGWKICNPEDMKRFSSIGYFFGKKLNKELSAPMGLINSSWGGTPAEVWTPKEVIESDAVLKEAASKLGPTPWGPYQPAKTFNAMIAPIIPYSISGALWYQGESNVGTYSSYTALMNAMIGSWRKAFEKDFPFYLVQIAPFNYGTEYTGALLREAQSKIKLPKTGMVVISDLVDDVNDIHPQNKMDVATRLADLALAEVYNKRSGAFKYPSYKNMVVEKDKIRISFDHAESGLMSKNGPPTEFLIAGDDKVFYKAQARIDGSTVVVSAKEVKNPVAVRFGFKNKSMPNLFSKEGLPVDLFRTDNWSIEEIKEQ